MSMNPQIHDQSTRSNGIINQSPIYRGVDPRRKNSFYAGLLSLLPGLGQVYVGYYQRGFINILIAGSIFSLLVSSEGSPPAPYMPLGVVFLLFFEVYNVIDAARRATLYNLSLDGIEQIELPDELTNGKLNGSYLGGGALLVFGVVALSNTAFGISLDWLDSYWPLFPIAFGAWLIYQAYQDSQKRRG